MRITINNFYVNLSSAIADLNEGNFGRALSDPTGAKVQVVRECDGTYTVRLLDEFSESDTIVVNKDIVLDLNSKPLTFTTMESCLSFGTGTNCCIDANGGCIVKDLEGETTGVAYLICADGASLRVNGGSYFCAGETANQVLAFRAGEGSGHLVLEDCTITAENSVSQAKCIQSQAAVTDVVNCTVTANGQGVAYGVFTAGQTAIKKSRITINSVNSNATSVRNMGGHIDIVETQLIASSDTYYAYGIQIIQGSVTIENSEVKSITYSEMSVGAYGISVYEGTSLITKNTTVLADAKGDSAIDGPLSIAISNGGTAYLENVTVNATHSGISSHGKLYVFGGDYTSFCHGGFYLNGDAECEAYINDAIIRGGHYYEDGLLDATALAGDKYGCLYIGGGPDSNNITAYLDGCTFDASDCHRSIIIRGSSGEQNNTINISNSTVMTGTLNEDAIRIDNATHKLNVGIGTNINTDSLKNKYLYPDENGGFPQRPADYEADGVVEYTNQLYRRVPDSHICNGKDYQAMYQWMKIQATEE